jgi:hypothetical protein
VCNYVGVFYYFVRDHRRWSPGSGSPGSPRRRGGPPPAQHAVPRACHAHGTDVIDTAGVPVCSL